MMIATAPGSPPDLTGSKSSKSSSFHSSSQFDQDGILNDISHFEDIGLDEIDEPYDSPPPHTNFDRHSLPKRPTARHPISMPTATRHSTPTMGTLRELTGSKRPQYPSLKGQVHSIVENQLHLPHGMRRGFTSSSTPSLAMSTMNRLHPRSRTPSPDASSLHNGSLPNQNGLHHARPSAMVNGKPRRDSWQPSRKSVQELEDEYHDSDEDIPDETVFWNVPMSPRPPAARSDSNEEVISDSPDRISPVSSISAVPPMPLEENIQNSLPKNPSGPPSPNKPHPNRGFSMGAFPTNGPDTNGAPKNRAKSWTAALGDLSEEAKILTEALEAFAQEKGRSHEALVQSGGKNGVVSRPDPQKRAKTTTIELPPLRKSNIMIDPLPISKEKEAVLTRTRPSWLPPKSQKEERRHLREYQKIMALSIEAERKRQQRLVQEQEQRDSQNTSILRIWDQHVLPNWDRVLREPRTRELWWRGVAPRSRGAVWQKAVGNELELTDASYKAALKRAKDLEAQMKKQGIMGIDENANANEAGPSDERNHGNTACSTKNPPSRRSSQEHRKEADWFKAICRDVGETFTELRIFQSGGPLHEGLVDVLMAYSMYRSDVGYVYGTHLIAGLLMLNMPPAASFITLANMLNRPLPLAFYTADSGAISRAYALCGRALAYKFPQLYHHLTTTLALPASAYLEPMFRTLFSGRMSIDIVSRIWDVYVFEGDAFLIRCAVGVLGTLEGGLYGNRDEALDRLGWRAKGELRVGAEDDFMRAVRSAGKQEGSRPPNMF